MATRRETTRRETTTRERRRGGQDDDAKTTWNKPVAGANSGLGLETAARLAAAGADVVATARTDAKAKAAVAAVKEQTGVTITGVALDLADLSSVKSLPSRLPAKKIDVLVENAGVMAIPERLTTRDGAAPRRNLNALGSRRRDDDAARGSSAARRGPAAAATWIFRGRGRERSTTRADEDRRARAVERKSSLGRCGLKDSAAAVAPTPRLCHVDIPRARNGSRPNRTKIIDVAVERKRCGLRRTLRRGGTARGPRTGPPATGFERQIGVNHLGHFALVAALLPLLEKAGTFRVVAVSSSAHTIPSAKNVAAGLDAGLDPDYNAWGNYGLSKACNVLFAKELQRRFDAKGLSASAVALHPGVARRPSGIENS